MEKYKIYGFRVFMLIYFTALFFIDELVKLTDFQATAAWALFIVVLMTYVKYENNYDRFKNKKEDVSQ